jgi:hypothetical protein
MVMPDAVKSLILLKEPPAGFDSDCLQCHRFSPTAQELFDWTLQAFPQQIFALLRIAIARVSLIHGRLTLMTLRRRDWGWQPDYDCERAFSEYLSLLSKPLSLTKENLCPFTNMFVNPANKALKHSSFSRQISPSPAQAVEKMDANGSFHGKCRQFRRSLTNSSSSCAPAIQEIAQVVGTHENRRILSREICADHGGSSGIGFAIANALVELDASVILLARDYEKLKAARLRSWQNIQKPKSNCFSRCN